ncbi:hypothetical protein MTBLM1_190006 [Rhodospirillaceae bacterium LM-1]|nr:hypothetical protein MTBLM1_190006 [Rhodospirillaceae bacterium LM-1]
MIHLAMSWLPLNQRFGRLQIRMASKPLSCLLSTWAMMLTLSERSLGRLQVLIMGLPPSQQRGCRFFIGVTTLWKSLTHCSCWGK